MPEKPLSGDQAFAQLALALLAIYDIAGFVGAEAPAGFTVSVQNTGTTAPLTAPPDNAAIPNVTFTYTGGAVATDTSFLNAIITSTVAQPAIGFFSGQTTNVADVSSKLGNAGNTVVPAVPEPSGVALMGAGVVGHVGYG